MCVCVCMYIYMDLSLASKITLCLRRTYPISIATPQSVLENKMGHYHTMSFEFTPSFILRLQSKRAADKLLFLVAENYLFLLFLRFSVVSSETWGVETS